MLSTTGPADLFDGLATSYQAYRPTYARSVLAALVDFASPLPGDRVIDIATGTGILLRQLHEALGPGLTYVGIEPSSDMLATARGMTPEPAVFIEAKAEAVPLPGACAALTTVAQALHWLDRPCFYKEAERLLAPGGTLAILYNERDAADPLMAAYERLTRDYNSQDESTAQNLAGRGGLGIKLLRDGTFRREIVALAKFKDVVEIRHAWQRHMHVEEFIGMCHSTVQWQNVMRALGADQALTHLRGLIGEHREGEKTLTIPYFTTMIAAKRCA